jgi:hypothetical protein
MAAKERKSFFPMYVKSGIFQKFVENWQMLCMNLKAEGISFLKMGLE